MFDRANSDELDRAATLSMETTSNAVAEIQQKCKQTQSPRADGTYEIEDCEDCSNEIGEGRLRAAIKNTLCIHCATRRERFNV